MKMVTEHWVKSSIQVMVKKDKLKKNKNNNSKQKKDQRDKWLFPLCVSALENHLLTKGCSHFLVASYTLSLLQVYFEPAILLNRAATTPGTSCPTLFDKCVGSLTSHGILELKEL